jgi:SOS-response transcriptional repressor LexA
MIEAFIGDRDIAIIRRQETSWDGDIVAAVVD